MSALSDAQFHKHAKHHQVKRKTEVRTIAKGRHGNIKEGQWVKKAKHGS
jgi:hypothetical protein